MKKLISIAVLLLHSLASFSMKVLSGEDITISQPVYDDVYIAAGTVNINAPVYGDLVVGGGTVIINDSILNDLLVGGGTVTLNGYIGDDVRATGGEIMLKGHVAGDVAAAGGNIDLGQAAMVIGNVMIGAGTATLNGTINGKLTSRAGELIFNGTASEDVDCRGGEILMNGIVKGKSTLAATELTIGNNAEFYGDVAYWSSKQPVDFKQSVKYGDARYEPALEIESDQWQYLGFASILGLLWYLVVVFIFIMLIQWLFGRTMKNAANIAFTNTMRSFGFGFLFLVAAPVAILFLFITVIGIPLALLTMLGYITLLLLATSISSVVIANWISNRGNRNWGNGTLSVVALGVFVLLKMLTLMPLLGWLMMLLVACLVFGSIIQSINWKRRREIVRG